MCVRVATDKHTLCILPFKWLSSALAVASAVGILHNSDIATARAPKGDPGRAIAADGGGWALLRPCSAIIIAPHSQKVKEVMRYVNW